MWIKVVTTKTKIKGKRAKRVHRYVKVMDREYKAGSWHKREVVIATLGTLEQVNYARRSLIQGLNELPLS